MRSEKLSDLWINRDLHDIMLRRHEIAAHCKIDFDYRARIQVLCERDIVFFANNFVFTSDPRNAARSQPISIPFILFEKQKECLAWIEQCYRGRKFGLIAKSRDAGISYLCSLFHLHKWLFTADYVGILGSRKEILVDRLGDLSSLFGKLRFMIYTLPGWLKPDYQDSYLKLINKSNGSSLLGEAGSNIGRGARGSLVFLDEAAFLDQPDKIMAALSQTADCVIRVSTPNGSGDLFANDYLGGKFPTFSLTWKDDPRKNQWIAIEGTTGTGNDAPVGAIFPWYEEQKRKLSPLTIARELDVSFDSSAEGVVIKAEWVRASVNYAPASNSKSKRVAGLDIAGEGKDRSVFVVVEFPQCSTPRVILIESWQGLNTTQTARRAIELCHRHEVELLNFDVGGLGYGVASTLQSSEGLRFRFRPLNSASSPSELFWIGEQRTSKDKFANLRAEMYFIAARRFEKTWENLNVKTAHDPSECLSIPSDVTLISQLSMTASKYTDTGKLLLTSKKDMPISPDFADALVFSLYPDFTPQWVYTKASW